jgi:DNA repair protein RadA/Sms
VRGIPLRGGERPLAAFGELGLTGELRHVAHHSRRAAEAARFGLGPALSPGDSLPDLGTALQAALGGAERPAVAA